MAHSILLLAFSINRFVPEQKLPRETVFEVSPLPTKLTRLSRHIPFMTLRQEAFEPE